MSKETVATGHKLTTYDSAAKVARLVSMHLQELADGAETGALHLDAIRRDAHDIAEFLSMSIHDVLEAD